MPAASTSPAGDLAPNGWPRAQLEGFRAGDRAALTAVYAAHVGQLIVFLRRGFTFDSRGRALRFAGFRSSLEVHDAVQESFRRAFEAKARCDYDGLRPFGAWLGVIARNVVLKEYRRKERLFVDVNSATAAEEVAQRGAAADASDPELALERARVRLLVREFMASLEPGERELLNLRFLQGLGQRDAAVSLGIGRQRLRTREAKLRETLVRFLVRRGHANPRGGMGIAGALAAVGLGSAIAQLEKFGELRELMEILRETPAAAPAESGGVA